MRRRHAWLAALLALGIAGPAAAQGPRAADKAAFLLKFVRYVQWPEAAQPKPGEAYQLCILGRDPLGPALDGAVAKEAGDGNPVQVRRLPDATDVAGCHIALIGATNDAAAAAMLADLARQPTLTVTDGDQGTTHGMIHFMQMDGRLRFQVDPDAAGARGIAISSRLIALGLDPRQPAR